MVQKLFVQPFAGSGDRTPPIPDATQSDGSVSFTIGYGPDYERQLGVDPQAKDISRESFNSLMFDVTAALQEMQSGAGVAPWSLAFAQSLPGGGYPIGALVPRADNLGLWRNTVAANSADPAVGAGWVPAGVLGVYTIPLTSGSVVVNATNAAFPVLILTGALTGDVTLTLPNWTGYTWQVDNRCTGSFTVSAKTVGQVGSTPLALGAVSLVRCDGVGIASQRRQITTSDTSAGALAIVGTFGAGAQCATGEADLNNYQRGGRFLTPAAPTNYPGSTVFPAGPAMCVIEVTGGRDLAGTAGPTMQMLTVVAAGSADIGKQATRVFDGSTWTAWRVAGGATVPAASETVSGILKIATATQYADGTDNTTAVTPLRIKADRDRITALETNSFSRSYLTPDQPITTGGTGSIPNPLAAAPRLWQTYLRCITAEYGYTAGQILSIPSTAVDNAYALGISVLADASAISYKYGTQSGVFPILNLSTGATSLITVGNWRVFIRIWT